MKKKRILLTGIAGIISAIALLPVFYAPKKANAFTVSNGAGQPVAFFLNSLNLSQLIPLDNWILLRPNTSYNISFTLTIKNQDWLYNTGLTFVKHYYTDGSVSSVFLGGYSNGVFEYNTVLPRDSVYSLSLNTASEKTLQKIEFQCLPNMDATIKYVSFSPVNVDFASGYDVGFADGKTNSDTEKFNEGYHLGQSTRSTADYQDGYSDGQTDSNVVMGFFPKIFGAVGSFFVDTLGSITLFGISLWQLVITVVGLAVLVFLLKMVV